MATATSLGSGIPGRLARGLSRGSCPARMRPTPTTARSSGSTIPGAEEAFIGPSLPWRPAQSRLAADSRRKLMIGSGKSPSRSTPATERASAKAVSGERSIGAGSASGSRMYM